MMRITLFFCLLLTLLFAPGANLFGQAAADQLEHGKVIERELSGGGSQTFAIKNPGNRFVFLYANQKGIDVVLAVFAPDGSKMIEVDSPNGVNGREPIWIVLDAPGRYSVEVRSLESNAKPGKFEVSIGEILEATPDLRLYAAAKKVITEAIAIATSRDADRIPRSTARLVAATGIVDQIQQEKGRKAFLLQQLAGYYAANRVNETALDHFDRAAALYLEAGMKREAMNAIRMSTGRAPTQLDFIARNVRVRELAVELNDRMMEAAAFIEEGKGYYELGDFSKAIEVTRRGLDIATEIKNEKQIGSANNNLGAMYTAQANFAAALEAHQRAIEIEMMTDKKPKPDSMLNLGNVYHGLGNYPLAIESFQKAYDEFERTKANVGMSYAISNIGSVYLEMGQYEKALEFFLKAQPMKAKFLPDDPTTYHNLAAVHEATGRFEEAIQNVNKAIEQLKRTGDNDGMARSLQIKADILIAQQNFDAATACLNDVVEISDRLSYPRHLWIAKATLAKIRLRQGNKEDAKRLLNESIAVIEKLREQVITQEGSEHFFEAKTDPYRLLTSLLVAEGRLPEAFLLEESVKARSLLDVLSTGRIDINKSLTKTEIEAETAMRLEMASLNSQIAAESDRAKKDALASKLEKKRLEYQDLRTRLYAVHPVLGAERGETKPSGVADSTDLLRQSNSVLIEFAIGDETSFVYVITADDKAGAKLRVYPVSRAKKDVTDAVESLRRSIGTGDLGFQGVSRELYDLLLKPATAQLTGKTNIIIVPDGPLWDLPFQALQDEKGKFLIEKAAVSFAPSLTALREMSKKAKSRRPAPDAELLAFGNPIVGTRTKERVQRVFMSEKLEPIPEAERLVNSLAKMYGPKRGKVFTGADALEEVAKTESPKYRIVQFATHGVINHNSPMYSHLVLAQNEKNPNEDGLLEAWELKDLDLKADMVILSACETARGKISNGEGMIGMTWASFIAGAPTTVASQWKVESTSTTELMLEFHRQLLTGKVSKSEALRRASLRVMKMPGFKHPSYWAGFVIVGDGS